jgi:hypothetical protein
VSDAASSRDAAPWRWAAAVVAVAVCARLPFLGVGLVPDEGGYAYVAAAWADGKRLYHDAWVDRPQGILLLYRALLALHHDAVAVRLGAIAAGATVTALLLAAGWLGHSRRAGVWAAAVYAIAGVAPRLEGYTLHGELASAAPSTAALAAALAWQRGGRPWLLPLAGALGGAALLMKQSGFDGLAAALVVALRGAGRRPERLGRGALVVAGAALPLAVAGLHGAALGFREYWRAVAGYRLAAGPSVSERAAELAGSLDLAAADLLPLALVAAAGAVCARAGGGGGPMFAWVGAAFLGFHVGGAYWAHYYMQLLAPLSLLAGVAIAAVPRMVLRTLVAMFAVSPTLILLARLAVADGERRLDVVPSQRPAERDERVALYLRRRTSPDDRIYVLVSRPNVYFVAGREPPTRYLWHPPLRSMPGAMADLRRTLAGPRAPAFVVLYQPVDHVDPSGRLGRVLAQRYVADRRAPPGVPPILAHAGGADGRSTARVLPGRTQGPGSRGDGAHNEVGAATRRRARRAPRPPAWQRRRRAAPVRRPRRAATSRPVSRRAAPRAHRRRGSPSPAR